MSFEPASSVLAPFTVLDLTRVRSSPTCVRQFADWGANVIKIEQPSQDVGNLGAMGGARDGPDFQNQERGATQVVGHPVILTDAESEVVRPPPLLGQHTAEVLKEIDYNTDDIKKLAEDGVT